MSEKLGTAEDRALWQGFQAGAGAARPRGAVSAEDLAGWLDGRLTDGEAARVEAAVAADPTLLDAVLDVRAQAGVALPPAPERLLVRARAMVAPPIVAAPRAAPLSVWFSGWRGGVQFGAVAMLVLGISVSGFALGGATQAALAGQRQWTGSLLSEVFDSLGDTALPGFADAGTDQ